MNLAHWLCGVPLVLVATGCGGGADDTESSALTVTNFQTSSCKSTSASDTSATLLTTESSGPYAGLGCIAWKASTDGAVKFDLINLSASCGFPGDAAQLWKPAAKRNSDGSLRLEVQWNFPYQNACGICLYDFSLEVSGVTADRVTSVQTATRACNDAARCPWTTDLAPVPLATLNEGVVCRYLPNLQSLTRTYTPGALHMPPREGTCDPGLVPIAVGASQLCAQMCTADADCPLPGVLACQTGACRLSGGW